MKYIVALFSMLLLSASAQSAETGRTVDIQRIAPIAEQRPADPRSQGYTRIYVNEAAWGSTSCRGDAADIRNEDEHLLSVLLAGWMGEKTITLFVDDTLRPLDSSCQVTWVQIQ